MIRENEDRSDRLDLWFHYGILKSVTITPSIVFDARGSVNGFIIWMWEPSLFDAKGFVNGFIIWMWEPSLFGAIVFEIFFFPK